MHLIPLWSHPPNTIRRTQCVRSFSTAISWVSDLTHEVVLALSIILYVAIIYICIRIYTYACVRCFMCDAAKLFLFLHLFHYSGARWYLLPLKTNHNHPLWIAVVAFRRCVWTVAQRRWLMINAALLCEGMGGFVAHTILSRSMQA